MYTEIIAIRHGKTESNLHDLVSGGNDNPLLVDEGLRQAREKAVKLRGRVSNVFSSPKERCIVTGRIVFGLPIPPSRRLHALNERFYGQFDGGPNDAWKEFMDSKQPELNVLSDEAQRDFNFGPGIENENQLIFRATQVFRHVARLNPGEQTGISTSGGILRGVLLGCGIAVPTGSIDNLAELYMAIDTAGLHYVESSGIHITE